MAITDADVNQELSAYLEHHPHEAGCLAEPTQLLARARDVASRQTYPMHVTAGALLTRGTGDATAVLLVAHRAYGLLLQPGGHLEPIDSTLLDAALRELTEETGIDPSTVAVLSSAPVYVEFGLVPARPDKAEPAHHHLDFGYAFTTVDGDVGRIQESEVWAANWYPVATAERLVGSRIACAVIPVSGPESHR